MQYHFERALFIVGEPNSGKSTQLRSMFRNIRLGNEGNIPAATNLREMYRLSNERCLYLRLTSPHEAGECIDQIHGDNIENFLDKTQQKISSNTTVFGRRWNFACPLQPNAHRYMPNVVDTVTAFVTRFDPERTRVLFLSPDRHGNVLQNAHVSPTFQRTAPPPSPPSVAAALRAIRSVEIAWIDARDRIANGLLIADFFDFT